MHFSGKVTHSVYNYLVRNISDTEQLYEITEISMEKAKDPTSWIQARQVENFLEAVEKEYSHLSTHQSLISNIGFTSVELRSWGVLDSVLKMMQDPQDIFGHPQRFLSYFISPAPPIANVVREKDSIGFDLPLSPEEYPLFSEFLKSAIEGLPQYTGKTAAVVRWVGTRMEISWNVSQENLFEAQNQEVNIKPELIRSLIQYLEEAQSELETKKKELVIKDQEIEHLKSENLSPDEISLNIEQQVMLENMRSQFYRLFDYMGRASQLITLLVKQDRQDRQVQEAMKRVDWENILESLPQIKSTLLSQVNELTSLPGVEAPIKNENRHHPSLNL